LVVAHFRFVLRKSPAPEPVGAGEAKMTLIAVLVLGFFLGMRHATDPDHVVAITTIVGRKRTTRSALAVGALWGLGHTVTLLAVGGGIVLFGVVIPPKLGLSMEMSVAVMLIVLGAMNLSGALKSIDRAAHAAGGQAPVPIEERHALRPLLIGVVHGLAGSAAVALLVLATIREAAWGVLYLALFGVGTVVGMMLLTTAMFMPIAFASRRFGSAPRILARATGVLSIAFGLFLAYRIGIVDGLFVGEPNWTPR
jgi:cytochrome c biogenesis protein CcdA